MMTLASHLSALTPPRIRVNLFGTQQSRQVPSVQAQGRRSPVTVIRLIVAAQSHEPNSNIPKIQLNEVKKRLIEVIPEPLKQVPWDNAGNIFLNNLLDAAEKALKLFFLPLVILSALCDVVFSVLKNKELLIPVGLFAGCALADLLNEAFRELFSESEVLPKSYPFLVVWVIGFVRITDGFLNDYQQQSGSSRRLLYFGCFFVLTRFACLSLPLSASVLLMHVANGGLMQVLWLWRNSREASRNNNGEEGSVLS